jgi:hypothetical protein
MRCCAAYDEAENAYAETMQQRVQRAAKRSKAKQYLDLPPVESCRTRLGRPPVLLCLGVPMWCTTGLALVIEYFDWGFRAVQTSDFKAINAAIANGSLSVVQWLEFAFLCAWGITMIVEFLLYPALLMLHCGTMAVHREFEADASPEIERKLERAASGRVVALSVYWCWVLEGICIAVAYFFAGLHVSVSVDDRWLLWAVMVGIWIAKSLQLMYVNERACPCLTVGYMHLFALQRW